MRAADVARIRFATTKTDRERAEIRDWLKRHGAAERSLARRMRTFFREQAAAILADLGRLEAVPADVEAFFRPREWDERLIGAATEGVGILMARGARHEWKLFNKTTDPPSVKELGFEQLLIDLPVSVKLELRNQLAAVMAKPYWKAINDTTKQALFVSLREGIEGGENLYELTQRIKSKMDGPITTARAVAIARTEATGALNAGQHAAQRQLYVLGLIKGKRWLSILDNKTRKTHVLAHRQTRSVRAMFTVGGHSCMHPGDPNLPGEERVHCRCTTISVPADGVPGAPRSS